MPDIRLVHPLRSSPFASVVLAALALACCSCATSVAISGRIAQPAPPSGSPVQIEDAIVYVEALGPMLDRWTPATRHDTALRFDHGSLEPRVSAAAAGTRLRVENRDSVFHRPFSVSPAAAFDARVLGPGESRTIDLRTGGVVQVFCEHHKLESASVLVLTHGAWTHPDAGGRFTLPPLPRGGYRVHLWHPQLGERVTPVTIAHPGPITLEMSF